MSAPGPLGNGTGSGHVRASPGMNGLGEPPSRQPLKSERRGITFGEKARKEGQRREGGSYTSDLFHHFIRVERHPNGGATVVRMDQAEFGHLPSGDVRRLAELFFREVFRELSEGVPAHVMGIVHNAVAYLPEMVGYLAETRPELVVKSGHLRKSEIESVRMEEFASRVAASYCQGTFRSGPLQQLSLVGQVAEEAGGFFPDLLGELAMSAEPVSIPTFHTVTFIASSLPPSLPPSLSPSFHLSLPPSPFSADLLERSPFLEMTLPWGGLSALRLTSRSHSDDGPILWVRPGEQLIPTAEVGGTPRKRRM